jgi:hypothetical protein
MANSMNVLQLIKTKQQKIDRQKQAQLVNIRIGKCAA